MFHTNAITLISVRVNMSQ